MLFTFIAHNVFAGPKDPVHRVMLAVIFIITGGIFYEIYILISAMFERMMPMVKGLLVTVNAVLSSIAASLLVPQEYYWM